MKKTSLESKLTKFHLAARAVFAETENLAACAHVAQHMAEEVVDALVRESKGKLRDGEAFGLFLIAVTNARDEYLGGYEDDEEADGSPFDADRAAERRQMSSGD